MMFTRRLLFLLFLAFSGQCSRAQTRSERTLPTNDAKMKWFRDGKLGIFIHWGIYAVDGIAESWSFYNGDISHDDYLKQLKGFTASKYDPQYWADLIKESGARYAVLTSKHHDGVALWNSRQGGLSVVKDTPAGRDLIQPFVDALRRDNLKVGLYFSLIDWSYADYDNFTKQQKRYSNDPTRWNKFLRYYQGQLKEISDAYDPDLYWFDGDWEHSAEEWQATVVRQMILTRNPNAILNSRLQGYGDYATPEQGVPIVRPKAKYWELCLTTNNSWGYQPRDTNYKTPNQLIRILADTIGMGGNLLLDIGPRPDGTIPEEQVRILKEIGRWTGKHSEAVYGTDAGIARDYFSGASTLSADGKTLYLFLDGKPNGPALVKGLKNTVLRARVVGNSAQLSFKVVGKQPWSQVPGLFYIDVPAEALDPQVTVVAVELDEPIQLYVENE